VKAGLQLRLAQHLTLTPQLQQSIRLLQLSTLELQQEIERAVLDNPLLELEVSEDPDALAPTEPDDLARGLQPDADEASWGDGTDFEPTADGVLADLFDEAESAAVTMGEDAPGGALDEPSEFTDQAGADDRVAPEDWSTATANPDDVDPTAQRSRQVTLADHLCAQLPLLRLPEPIDALVRALIYCLDDDGFLAATADELAGALGIPIAEADWKQAVAVLHAMDPPGIGARSLQECLLLQLRDQPPDATRHRAERVVREAFEPLARGELARVRRIVGLDEVELAAVRALLGRLTPRPAASFADVAPFALLPDVIVRRSRRAWVAELNPAAVPRLSLNVAYVEALQRHREGRTTPLAAQLQEARWLVKNVSQRFETILRVASEIVQRQQAFFDHGEVAMRPLVLREVADALGLHESTVSRVTMQKYLACPRGTFELKFFFGSHVATESGGAASSTAIRAMIRDLVAKEDPTDPLTDSRIAELLGEQGIVVARRTVAKYRELQNIPPVSQRRRPSL